MQSTYFCKPPDIEYLDLSDYIRFYNKNTDQPLRYINEIQRATISDNSEHSCQNWLESAQ